MGAHRNLRRVSKVDKKVADESGQLSKVADEGEFPQKEAQGALFLAFGHQ